MIETYGRSKKKTFNELFAREMIDPGDLAGLQGELEALESALLDLEMYQVEQHGQLLSEFEVKYSELKNQSLEMQHNFFRAVEEHEEAFFNSVGQLAQDMLEKVAKDELPDDAPDELSSLLIDRDTCMNVVVGSHDIHVGKLLAREDETRAAEIRGMSDVIDARRAGESLPVPAYARLLSMMHAGKNDEIAVLWILAITRPGTLPGMRPGASW